MTDKPALTFNVEGIDAEHIIPRLVMAVVERLRNEYVTRVREHVDATVAGAIRTEMKVAAQVILKDGVTIIKDGQPVTVPFEEHVRGLMERRSSHTFQQQTRVELAINKYLDDNLPNLIKTYLDENKDLIGRLVADKVTDRLARLIER